MRTLRLALLLRYQPAAFQDTLYSMEHARLVILIAFIAEILDLEIVIITNVTLDS